MQKVILKISGMNCTSCALNIDFDLEDMGVISQTSYAKQETKIEFDEYKISLNQIIEQINKTGYSAHKVD